MSKNFQGLLPSDNTRIAPIPDPNTSDMKHELLLLDTWITELPITDIKQCDLTLECIG